MKINVVNKKLFDNLMKSNNITDLNVEQLKDSFFISITDTDKFSTSREPYFKENHENVINLSFDDCTEDGQPSPTQPEGTKAFNKDQALVLYKFIKKHLEKEQCIVHCMAGISRSGAVGTFINDITRGDYREFKRMNPQIVPNQHVKSLLNRAYYNDLK